MAASISSKALADAVKLLVEADTQVVDHLAQPLDDFNKYQVFDLPQQTAYGGEHSIESGLELIQHGAQTGAQRAQLPVDHAHKIVEQRLERAADRRNDVAKAPIQPRRQRSRAERISGALDRLPKSASMATASSAGSKLRAFFADGSQSRPRRHAGPAG